MCHVLIIEDQWLVADYIAILATSGGATSIITAATEGEAVQAAHERRPAIILSDVNISEGTGPRAVSAIIAEHGPIPVIFITATPEGCEPCGAGNVILTKPVSRAAFLDAFRMLAPL